MFGKLFNKISVYFFGELVSKYENRFKNYSKILNNANLKEDFVTYVSSILFFSVIFLFIFQILFIFLMIKIKIYFSLFSFIVTILLSVTFSGMILLILYRYPYYILENRRKEIDQELENTIKHLSVLEDENLTVNDVLNILLRLENNKLLTEEARKILTVSKVNLNLKDTLREAIKETYSDLEKNFFRKLIDVLDNKEKINKVVLDFMSNIEQSRKEASEQKKSKINLLFQVNIFLFFFVIILLISLFLISLDLNILRKILLIIAFVFPIIEFIFIYILVKG